MRFVIRRFAFSPPRRWGLRRCASRARQSAGVAAVSSALSPVILRIQPQEAASSMRLSIGFLTLFFHNFSSPVRNFQRRHLSSSDPCAPEPSSTLWKPKTRNAQTVTSSILEAPAAFLYSWPVVAPSLSTISSYLSRVSSPQHLCWHVSPPV